MLLCASNARMHAALSRFHVDGLFWRCTRATPQWRWALPAPQASEELHKSFELLQRLWNKDYEVGGWVGGWAARSVVVPAACRAQGRHPAPPHVVSGLACACWLIAAAPRPAAAVGRPAGLALSPQIKTIPRIEFVCPCPQNMWGTLEYAWPAWILKQSLPLPLCAPTEHVGDSGICLASTATAPGDSPGGQAAGRHAAPGDAGVRQPVAGQAGGAAGGDGGGGGAA